jgi:PIN domain nuclease of toxin-antitoxin system
LRLLLDTHTLLWALSAPHKLPINVGKALQDPRHRVFVSPVATWELVIKGALGKIRVDVNNLIAAVRATGFDELPIRFEHTVRVLALPLHHKDPFDRLLIAQALEESLTIVTKDSLISVYGVATLWAKNK